MGGSERDDKIDFEQSTELQIVTWKGALKW